MRTEIIRLNSCLPKQLYRRGFGIKNSVDQLFLADDSGPDYFSWFNTRRISSFSARPPCDELTSAKTISPFLFTINVDG